MVRTVLVICMLLITSAPTSARGFELGLSGYYWDTELSGDIRVDGSDILGTQLDFNDDLGIDDEASMVIETFWGVGRHHFMASIYHTNCKGISLLGRDITFNGETYYASDTIHSELELAVLEGVYRYDVIDLENIMAGFSIGLMGKIKVMTGSARIESERTGEQNKKDFTAPIPLLGAAVHVGLIGDLLEVRAMATGLGYAGNAVMDGQAELSLTPVPFLDITGGYRLFKIDIDEDEVEFKYDTSGPYIGLTLKF